MNPKPKVAFFDFACCEGCQLQIANLEEEVVERPQELMPLRTMEDRLIGFSEVEMGYTGDQAFSEACRCLRCDIRIEDNIGEQRMAEAASSH